MEKKFKMSDYKVTIGLEIHVALKTESKLFSRSACDFSSDSFSMFDAATPGFLPLISEKPIEFALRFALSVNAEIPKISIFERKHYFYPDSPLGYQITQQHRPIMIGGTVPIEIDGQRLDIQIEHAHLECDAAKSLHDKFSGFTAIDLSRGSSPLIEIVSTPCMHSPKEAKLYAQTVCELVKYIDICDGKLEEGSFRVDASISLSKTDKLGTRVEIKNISSFSFLEEALNYEIERQTELLDSGKEIDMETRLFNESSLTTHSMRKKETAQEYRYMPDPDIPAIYIEDDMLNKVKETCDVHFFKRKQDIINLFSNYDFKECHPEQYLSSKYKKVWSNIVNIDEAYREKFIRILAYWLPEIEVKQPSDRTLSSDDLTYLSKSNLAAKECKEAISTFLNSQKCIKDCIPVMLDESFVVNIIKETLAGFEEQVNAYKAGNTKLLQFLIGKCMAQLKGKAQANIVKELVEKELSN